MSLSTYRRRMVEALLAISERDRACFSVEDSYGEIRIHGPCNTAVYRADSWISQFTRDVYSGYFDRPPQPHEHMADPGGIGDRKQIH